MDEEKVKSAVKEHLHYWSTDHELVGAYIMTIVDHDTMEVEIRKTGRVKEFRQDEFRSALMMAAEKKESGWDCSPSGVGFPVRYEKRLIGLCILFPRGDIQPTSRWEKETKDFASRVGPVMTGKVASPPSLKRLVESIPERSEPSTHDPTSKLHWERSKARVDMPVQEELAQHLLLDHLPLF